MKKLSVLVFVLLGSALPGWTQQPGNASTPCCDAIEQHMKAMEDRIILLEGQVRLLKEQLAQTQATGAAVGGETAASAAPPVAAASPVAATAAGEGGAQLPVYGGASAAAKALNPDISAIGDFIGAAGHYPTPPGSLIRQVGFQSLTMHESEIGLQAIIDPWNIANRKGPGHLPRPKGEGEPVPAQRTRPEPEPDAGTRELSRDRGS